MSELVMRDSITAADIPLDGLAAVAGYGDGPWTWSSQDWKRFDDAGVPALSIVIDPAHQGDILDVERFDAEPIQVPGWIRRFNRPKRRKPTIYCNRLTWRRGPGSPAITVVEALHTAGMDESYVDWWAATLDGTTTNTEGAVAVQWKGQDETGGHYDESIIMDSGWIGGDISVAQYEEIMKRLNALGEQINAVDAVLRYGSDQGSNPETWHHQFFEGRLPDSLSLDAIAEAVVAKLPVGTGGAVDVKAIAKAVNDEFYRRQES
jgi:hypothetical protein